MPKCKKEMNRRLYRERREAGLIRYFEWVTPSEALALKRHLEAMRASEHKEFIMNSGTNYAGKHPSYVGEVVRFLSPHADVELYDIAELDIYGRLTWVALSEEYLSYER